MSTIFLSLLLLQKKGIVILFEYFNRIHLPTRSTRQRMKIQKNLVASFVKIKKKEKKNNNNMIISLEI